MKSTSEMTNGAFGPMEHWSTPQALLPRIMSTISMRGALGEMAFVRDGKWIKGGPGAYVFGPSEIPHGLKVIGTTPARMILMCAPAGFERFVLEMAEDLTSPAAPPDMAKLVALAAKYKIDVLGPLPDEIDGRP